MPSLAIKHFIAATAPLIVAGPTQILRWGRIRMYLRSLILIAAAVAIAVPADAAGFQRMGFAPGIYRVAASGTSGIEAFCYDWTRKSPNVYSKFTQVLTDPRAATVKIGQETMTVQAAVDAKKIEIRGTQATPEQLTRELTDPATLRRLTPSRQEVVRRFLANWKKLPRDQQVKFLAEHGNHEKLVVVNLTDQPVVLNIAEQTVFGDTRESTPNLVSHGNGDHLLRQKRIWAQRTAWQQKQLRDAGFYRGAADGKLNERFLLGVELLRKGYNLPRSLEIDSDVEKVLANAVTEAQDIGRLNKDTERDYVVMNVRRISGTDGGLFQVLIGPGAGQFMDSANGLGKAARTFAKRVGVGRAYIRPQNFSSDQLKALKFSLHNDNIGSDVPVVLDENAASVLAHDELLGKGVRDVVVDDAEPILVPATGRYKKDVSLVTHDGARVNFSVYGRTKEIVQAFIQNLKLALAHFKARYINDPVALARISPADLATFAFAETAKKTGRSELALRRELSVQLRATEAAWILRRAG